MPRLAPIDLTDHRVAARVVAIQRTAYRLEADLIGFDGIPGLAEEVEDVRGRSIQWLGSHEDDELVGLIGWTVTGTHCDIDRLAVDPAHHRRGHARALVASLLVHDRLTVSTGAANTPALRLYESLGFRTVRTEDLPGVTIVHLER